LHENLISFSRDISQFDLIPVSASVNLLQRMINTCCEEAVYLAMKFDALKSNNISWLEHRIACWQYCYSMC